MQLQFKSSIQKEERTLTVGMQTAKEVSLGQYVRCFRQSFSLLQTLAMNHSEDFWVKTLTVSNIFTLSMKNLSRISSSSCSKHSSCHILRQPLQQQSASSWQGPLCIVELHKTLYNHKQLTRSWDDEKAKPRYPPVLINFLDVDPWSWESHPLSLYNLLPRNLFPPSDAWDHIMDETSSFSYHQETAKALKWCKPELNFTILEQCKKILWCNELLAVATIGCHESIAWSRFEHLKV